jgi:hypothetical protein
MAFDKKKFKESMKKTFSEIGESVKKVMKNVEDPLKKIDEDMKKNMGNLY